MLPSRRPLFRSFNSFRYNYVSGFSSISHNNQAIPTTEDLSRLYKTEEVGPDQVDDIKAPGVRHDGTQTREDRRKGGERRREDLNTVAELARAGVVGAVDTGLTLGKIAKQTMDGMWDAVEKTAESVRDSVADDSRHRSSRTSLNPDGRRSESDKFVEDLRGQGGGYDLKNRR